MGRAYKLNDLPTRNLVFRYGAFDYKHSVGAEIDAEEKGEKVSLKKGDKVKSTHGTGVVEKLTGNQFGHNRIHVRLDSTGEVSSYVYPNCGWTLISDDRPKVGDRVKTLSYPQTTGKVVSASNGGYSIEYDKPIGTNKLTAGWFGSSAVEKLHKFKVGDRVSTLYYGNGTVAELPGHNKDYPDSYRVNYDEPYRGYKDYGLFGEVALTILPPVVEKAEKPVEKSFKYSFKKGDRVQLLSGRKGTIQKDVDSDDYYVWVNITLDDGRNDSWYPSGFKKVESKNYDFKVGDRVRYTSEINSKYYGKEGVVAVGYTGNSRNATIDVNFDNSTIPLGFYVWKFEKIENTTKENEEMTAGTKTSASDLKVGDKVIRKTTQTTKGGVVTTVEKAFTVNTVDYWGEKFNDQDGHPWNWTASGASEKTEWFLVERPAPQPKVGDELTEAQFTSLPTGSQVLFFDEYSNYLATRQADKRWKYANPHTNGSLSSDNELKGYTKKLLKLGK